MKTIEIISFNEIAKEVKLVYRKRKLVKTEIEVEFKIKVLIENKKINFIAVFDKGLWIDSITLVDDNKLISLCFTDKDRAALRKLVTSKLSKFVKA